MRWYKNDFFIFSMIVLWKRAISISLLWAWQTYSHLTAFQLNPCNEIGSGTALQGALLSSPSVRLQVCLAKPSRENLVWRHSNRTVVTFMFIMNWTNKKNTHKKKCIPSFSQAENRVNYRSMWIIIQTLFITDTINILSCKRERECRRGSEVWAVVRTRRGIGKKKLDKPAQTIHLKHSHQTDTKQ